MEYKFSEYFYKVVTWEQLRDGHSHIPKFCLPFRVRHYSREYLFCNFLLWIFIFPLNIFYDVFEKLAWDWTSFVREMTEHHNWKEILDEL